MTAAETHEGKYGLTESLFYCKLEEYYRNSSGVWRLETTTILVKSTTAELCKMVDATSLDTYGVQKETSSNLVQLIKGNLKQCRLAKDEPFTWTPLHSLISGVEPTLVFALNQIHPAETTSTQIPSSMQLTRFAQR